MLDPRLDLPDGTLLAIVRMPTKLRNALYRADLISVGDIRSTPFKTLWRQRYIGPQSLSFLRRTLGFGNR